MTNAEAKAAKAAGQKTYECNPDKYGHTRRYTSNSTCVQCSRNHSRRQYRARVQGYMATVEPLDHVAATVRPSATMGAVEASDVAALAILIEQTAEQKLFQIMSRRARECLRNAPTDLTGLSAVFHGTNCGGALRPAKGLQSVRACVSKKATAPRMTGGPPYP
jgi:hypothetical protein